MSDHDDERARILAEMDGAFAEQVLALDAVRQRKLAAWAARWACHFAAVDTRPDVAHALQYLEHEGRLPEPFNDYRVAQARIGPLQHEPSARVVSYTRPAGEGPRHTLVPWAAAFDATISADNTRADAAAVNALVGACGAQADPTQLITDARQYIASMV